MLFCCCLSVLNFLLFVYFHISLPTSRSLCMVFALTLVLLKVRQKGTYGLAYFLGVGWVGVDRGVFCFGTETNQSNEQGFSPFLVCISAGFPCCCYVPASSLWHQVQKLCVEASVNNVQDVEMQKLPRKKNVHIAHTREVHRGQGTIW